MLLRAPEKSTKKDIFADVEHRLQWCPKENIAMKVGIIVGSLRRESFSRRVAENVAGYLPAGVKAEWISADLPIYNQDLDDDGTPPRAWTEFRTKIAACDAFLFVSPEYNRSITPLMKNALDVASRPFGRNAWGGKKGAVISVSIGAMGGFGANHALRQVMVFLDVEMLAQPEMYVGGVDKKLDAEGKFDASTNEFFAKFAARFVEFVKTKS